MSKNVIKGIISIIMTVALCALLFIPNNPQKEILALFCTSYGSIITFFFTKRSICEENNNDQ